MTHQKIPFPRRETKRNDKEKGKEIKAKPADRLSGGPRVLSLHKPPFPTWRNSGARAGRSRPRRLSSGQEERGAIPGHVVRTGLREEDGWDRKGEMGRSNDCGEWDWGERGRVATGEGGLTSKQNTVSKWSALGLLGWKLNYRISKDKSFCL